MKRLIPLVILCLFFLFSGLKLCAQPCSINGASTLGVGVTSTYGTGNGSGGASFFWSVTGGLAINGSNSGSSVSVSAISEDPAAQLCVTRFKEGEEPCCNCETIPVICVPATSVNITTEPEAPCPGDEITFTASIAPGNASFDESNFYWEAGTGTPSLPPIVTFEGGKSYTWDTPAGERVWMRVTYTSCDGSMVTDVVIIEDCCVPAETVFITRTPNNACPGDEITFTANLVPGNAFLDESNFIWEGGVGSSASAPIIIDEGSKTFTWNTPEENVVWVRVKYTDCDGITVSSLTIVECCVPVTSLEINQIQVVGEGCPGETMEFQIEYQPPNATFYVSNLTWFGGEGIVFDEEDVIQEESGVFSFFFKTPESGQAWVAVTYDDCDGTEDEAFVIVDFDLSDCLKANNPTSLNRPMGINNNQIFGQALPNPFSESTNLMFTLYERAEVLLELFDLNGKVFYSNVEVLQEGKQNIEINHLPADQNGLIFYRLKANGEMIHTGKLIRNK